MQILLCLLLVAVAFASRDTFDIGLLPRIGTPHRPMLNMRNEPMRTYNGCCNYDCVMSCSTLSPNFDTNACEREQVACEDGAYFSNEYGGVVGPAVFPDELYIPSRHRRSRRPSSP